MRVHDPDSTGTLRGPRGTLPADVHSEMEGKLLSGFGDVRGHADDEAHASAQAMNARACTVQLGRTGWGRVGCAGGGAARAIRLCGGRRPDSAGVSP
jgi:hypothetical protein